MPASRDDTASFPQAPSVTAGRSRREPAGRSRRTLHPAVIATTALVAVGVGSAVGMAAFGNPGSPPSAARPAPAGGRPLAAPAAPGSARLDRRDGPSAPASPAGAGSATGAGAPAPAPPPAGATPGTPERSGPEAGVLDLVNQQRAQAGCKPLASEPRLVQAARGHSQDMAAHGYFDHTTPSGVGFDKRITATGYRFSTAGENIAEGQPTAASVMNSWMNSPGHRANILNCSYTQIGVGLAYAGRTPYWTQDFARPL